MKEVKKVKKVKKTAVSIVFLLVLMLSLPITAFAYSDDTSYDAKTGRWSGSHGAYVGFANAPDETAYIDILIKMDESDEDYVNFTFPPRKLVEYNVIDNVRHAEYEDLPIDENSEIAMLNDDGYISLSLHYKYTESLDIRHSEDEYDLLTVTRYDFLYVNKNYGDFKAAYVDENGNVLGITDFAKTTYEEGESYGFFADGDSLIFRKDGLLPGSDPWHLFKLMGIGFLGIAGLAFLVVLPLFSLGRAFLSKE